ncbi:class I SAM-dependent methyltransferase [Tissierella sp.]|uniref:tRNA (adenine(22)-N(1))-methyltransferase n=1 Tax=Tissierella sp. TaxID=41274 RepID=UPI00286295AA|nr:class I SAM-dependent methyltransferase [Tissierella sp.]MDR7857135.1 class I SAM-dependent methyltransferase [Tissierella sp.]
MKLSNRMMSIARLVPNNSIVGDIGTDHGFVPAYLIENNISKKVIGTDISKGSLDKIIEYVKELGFEDRIDTRLGDGLEVIKPYEVDTVIIAGMGGLLIRDILEKSKKVSDSIINFILQPMVATKELREYLISNNFEIIKEELIKEDNKYYELIYAKKGKSFVEKEIYYEISPILISDKHPLLREFIEFKINSSENIKEELQGIDTEKSKERYMELANLIKEYKEVLEYIES